MDHFVGRAGDLAILDAEMQAVRGGRPRVVLIEGEAGIGKSSLLSRWQFLARTRHRAPAQIHSRFGEVNG